MKYETNDALRLALVAKAHAALILDQQGQDCESPLNDLLTIAENHGWDYEKDAEFNAWGLKATPPEIIGEVLRRSLRHCKPVRPPKIVVGEYERETSEVTHTFTVDVDGVEYEVTGYENPECRTVRWDWNCVNAPDCWEAVENTLHARIFDTSDNCEALAEILREFCKDNGLKQRSADELAADTRNPVLDGWLSCFMTVWDALV